MGTGRDIPLCSREVCYPNAIQTVVPEVRGLMNVGAETWVIGER